MATRVAARVAQCWQAGTQIQDLARSDRPGGVEDGYAAQAELARLIGDEVMGWKLAATNPAGQAHIGVDAPLAGRLFKRFFTHSSARIPYRHNFLRVAEAEFAFRLGRDLPARLRPYNPEEVLDYVDSVHPAIELPDTRFQRFAEAGASCLIADNACAGWFVLGPAAPSGWRTMNLRAHPVSLRVNNMVMSQGHGADVLGGPDYALAWVANQGEHVGGLKAGEVVTTGVCGLPVKVAPGDRLWADFGALGEVHCDLTDES